MGPGCRAVPVPRADGTAARRAIRGGADLAAPILAATVVTGSGTIILPKDVGADSPDVTVGSPDAAAGTSSPDAVAGTSSPDAAAGTSSPDAAAGTSSPDAAAGTSSPDVAASIGSILVPAPAPAPAAAHRGPAEVCRLPVIAPLGPAATAGPGMAEPRAVAGDRVPSAPTANGWGGGCGGVRRWLTDACLPGTATGATASGAKAAGRIRVGNAITAGIAL